MCFTYLQENSSSQTNGLKRRLSQGSIYLYVVLHLLVAARFAFQFWKHVWFAFYICNVLMFTDPDSIVLLFSSSFLFTVKLLPLLLWIHPGRGLIALDTFLRLFQLRSPFLMLRIFTKYIAYWQHCFHISRLFRTLSNTWGFVSSISLRHLFERKVRRLGRYSIFLSFVPKGWEESPFHFFLFSLV